MKQLSQNLGNGTLKVEELPIPEIQPGQVQVRTCASLISAGTERFLIETGKKSLLGKALARPDRVRQVLQSIRVSGLEVTLQKVRSRLDSRSPLGYSASGVVIGVGEGVLDFRVGDRLACAGSSAGHAEIINVPVNLCAPVPDSVRLEEAAFSTLGAIALQGIRLGKPQIGECVVVIGLGLLGSLAVQMLRAAGCIVLGFDPSPERCAQARELGAHIAVAEEENLRAALAKETLSRGADLVLITAGTSSNRPVELAGELSREKGRVVVVGAVGLTLPREPYYNKEIEFCISRSYGPGRYDAAYEEKGLDYPYGYVRWTENRNMRAFLRLLADQQVRVKPLITHTFSLDQAAAAYDLISGKTGQPYLGVLFRYAEEPGPPKSIELSGGIARIPGDTATILGVIGAGTFAQSMLLPALKNDPRVRLDTVANQTPLRAMDAKERFGFRRAAASAGEVLDDPGISAVLIATRHDTHAELARKALQAGKAVFLEKPLALDDTQLAEVQQAYAAAPRPFLMVGFNRRFAPAVAEILSFLRDCREPRLITCRVNAGPVPLDHWIQDPARGGGRVIGEVCHFLDLLAYLAGGPAVSLYAQALPDLGKYRQDNLALTLTFADGSVASLLYAANGDRALPKEYLEVYCQGKVAVLRDYREVALIASGREKIKRFASQDKGHRAEMDAFLQALSQGSPEPVPFATAVAATRLSFAALRSIRDGEVIKLG